MLLVIYIQHYFEFGPDVLKSCFYLFCVFTCRYPNNGLAQRVTIYIPHAVLVTAYILRPSACLRITYFGAATIGRLATCGKLAILLKLVFFILLCNIQLFSVTIIYYAL